MGLEPIHPFTNPRFSRPLPLDQLGLPLHLLFALTPGLEPGTHALTVRYSNQLNYVRIKVESEGLEPSNQR